MIPWSTKPLLAASVLATLVTSSCKIGSAPSNSGLLMDLGGGGNTLAITAYQNLDTSSCAGAQVVVTGFFDFNGNANVTGGGLQRLADGGGTDTATASGTGTGSGTDPGNGSQTSNPNVDENGLTIPAGPPPGGMALVDPNTRVTLLMTTVEGVKACLAILPVNPLAPAFAHKIIRDTGVHFAYSLGQRSGTGYVESGSFNYTGTSDTYYDGSGGISTLANTSTRVVESDDADATVTYSWNRTSVAQVTGITVATAPRTANNYICNATGYVVASAIGRDITYLPGLTLTALPADLKQGFLHVTDADTNEQVAAAVRKVIKTNVAAAVAAAGAADPRGTTDQTPSP